MSCAYLNNQDKINNDRNEFNNQLETIRNTLESNNTCNCISYRACLKHIILVENNKTATQIENMIEFLYGNTKLHSEYTKMATFKKLPPSVLSFGVETHGGWG